MFFRNRKSKNAKKGRHHQSRKHRRFSSKEKSSDHQKKERQKKKHKSSAKRGRKISVILKEAFQGGRKGLGGRLRKAIIEIGTGMSLAMLCLICALPLIAISGVIIFMMFLTFEPPESVSSKYSRLVEEDQGTDQKDREFTAKPAQNLFSTDSISFSNDSTSSVGEGIESVQQEIYFLESKADMEFAMKNYKESEGLYQNILRIIAIQKKKNFSRKNEILRKATFRIFASQLAQGRRAEATIIFEQFTAQIPTQQKPPEWYYGRALIAFEDKDDVLGREFIKVAREQNFINNQLYEDTVEQMGYGIE